MIGWDNNKIRGTMINPDIKKKLNLQFSKKKY